MDLTRRELFARGAGLAGAAALASLPGMKWAQAAGAATRLPPPNASGIDHIVVVMMENRSFDHFLGWLPRADGRQAGLEYLDANGVPHATHHLDEFQGCAFADPDHSWEGGRTEYNGGRCDGFLQGKNDTFAIGYYTAADLAFYGHAAPAWTVCDRYFAAIMAETYPNRFYMHSAQTDRLHNSGEGQTPATLPTIWDRLANAGLRGRYYFGDVPFTALWGAKYLPISAPVASFYADAAAGTLPDVSYVDPRFLDEGSGSSGDDHPHADIRVGQQFVNSIYRAVTTSPQWSRTLLVITYDEWGGFFDHVKPPIAQDTNPAARLRGFRVPCLVVSPRARRNYVAHDVYDHTSVLKMIEWRFGLAPLTLRDASARNLAEVLDFTNAPNLSAPQWSVPPAVGLPCVPGDPAGYEEWKQLETSALASGFGSLV